MRIDVTRRSSLAFRHRRGFTLLELMIAITISAELLLGGRLLLEQIAAAEHSIVADTATRDTAVAHAQLLRSLVRNLEVGTDSLTTFSGDEQQTQFTSWCLDATFTRTRCVVHLTMDTTLVVTTSPGTATTVLRTATISHFRYLGDARNGGQWYRSWGVGITVPLAIGVIAGTDTIVLRIGERG